MLSHHPRTCQSCRPLTLDRRGETSAKSAWIRARKAEAQYASRLRRIAHVVGEIVRMGYAPDDPLALSWIRVALARYAVAIRPWAEKAAEVMVTEVASRDKAAWKAASEEIGRGLRTEIETAPIGDVLRQRMADQVDLITSLPRDAAERVHRLAIESIENGTRASEIEARILETGSVTKARATLIARTEVGRTATELNRARAEHVGSTHFIWRTVHDADVRATHRALDGKSFRWDEPPECDPGHHALPGCIWNCRCWAEPIIPD